MRSRPILDDASATLLRHTSYTLQVTAVESPRSFELNGLASADIGGGGMAIRQEEISFYQVWLR